MRKILDYKKEARRVLLDNFHKTGSRYICPSWPHYKSQWLWDSSFHAISCASLGLEDLAKNEIRQLLSFQDDRGWMPHQMYHNRYQWYDFERFLYGKGASPRNSSLVGMPVLAQAVEAVDNDIFTEEVIVQVIKFYKYFLEYRDAKNIISVISPRESGRDASPEFDFFRPVAPKKYNLINKALDPVFVLWLELRYVRMGWDENKILDSNIFNVKDVVAHCIWLDGLYSIRKLLNKIKKPYLFNDLDGVIKEAHNALLKYSWDDEYRAFFPIRVGYGKIKRMSLGSLFPLLSEDLSKEKADRIVELIKNPNEFWTPYPIPSVPLSDLEFDGESTFPIWRGPTWININWFIIRALVRHGYKDVAREIAQSSIKMVSRHGYYEFYSPKTGRGMRVKDFGWSTLAVTFPEIVGLS